MCIRKKKKNNILEIPQQGQRAEERRGTNIHPWQKWEKRNTKSKQECQFAFTSLRRRFTTAGWHQHGQFCIGQKHSPMTNCLQVQEQHFTNSAGQKLYFRVWVHSTQPHKEPGTCWGLCTLLGHKQRSRRWEIILGNHLQAKYLKQIAATVIWKSDTVGKKKKKKPKQQP